MTFVSAEQEQRVGSCTVWLCHPLWEQHVRACDWRSLDSQLTSAKPAKQSSVPLSPTESSGTQKIPAEPQLASSLWVTCTRKECLLSQAAEKDAKPKERA